MSAKALAVWSLEPAAEPTVATNRQAPEGVAAEIQFREDLCREYRLEAINAGKPTTNYATIGAIIQTSVGLNTCAAAWALPTVTRTNPAHSLNYRAKLTITLTNR